MTTSASNSIKKPKYDYVWPTFLPFVTFHALCLGALWTGVNPIDWIVCAVLYFVRIFGVMAGYHRYFAHRAFKTSRWFQFGLAFLAQTTAQKGVLWWAANHRHHHQFSDCPPDVHSPTQDGFWHSHCLWLAERGSEVTDFSRVRDLTRFPELVFLSRNWVIPPFVLAFTLLMWLGWSGLFIGFFFSTVLVWHVTFLVNSLVHVFGTQRFDTKDTSGNNWVLAVLTLGEGWHNNHHHYQSSARAGFYWYEFDLIYYILRALAWCGLIWDLRPVPAAVLADGRARDVAARRAVVARARIARAARLAAQAAKP